jgi:quercetin dioxygenase-like cupin family protein
MSTAEGFVVPAGGGKHISSPTPGRSFALKLLGGETNESIMMFEETLPAGTASLFHLHRDSDEVAWVLAGEFTFMIGDAVTVGGPGTCAFMPRDVPHAWKNTGSQTGRVLFLYTPAAAGGLIEALSERRPADDDERDKLFERHHWKGRRPKPTLKRATLRGALMMRRLRCGDLGHAFLNNLVLVGAAHFAPDFCVT